MSPTSAKFLLRLLAFSLLLSGCNVANPKREPFGKTFYLDGAGNLGFGTTDVPEGLRRAGYLGDCEVFNWSPTRIAIVDQIDPLGVNKLQAAALADKILKYKRRFPGQEVNIIALSAGTGVAVWALEKLKGRVQVDNVFLLGSSLASHYDIRRALRSVKGKLYVYYSQHDAILKFVRVIGTVDGRLYARVAGLVGLQGKGSKSGQVVNIGWEEKWERLAWNGGHTDCVSRPFVQYEIARKLMNELPEPPTPDAAPPQEQTQAARPAAGSSPSPPPRNGT